MKADVVVLGAGIVGAAIARQLARVGQRVVLVDAADPCSGTSGRCDGNVLVQTKHDTLGVEMTRHSIERYRQWASELGEELRFEQPGSLVVFTDEEGLDAGRRRTSWLAAIGVRARFVDGDEARGLEPNLSDRVLGGVDCADDASVYPPGVVACLVRDFRRHGGVLLPRTSARRLLVSARSKAVRGVDTDAGPIEAPYVVNAMGVWSGELDGDPELRIPIEPRQGVLAVTEEAGGLVRRAVTEDTYMTTRASRGQGSLPGVAFVAEPTFHGNVLLGSSRRFCGYDTQVDTGLLTEVMRRALAFLPALADVHVIRAFAGLRPWTPDNRPLIGASANVAGHLLATGHEGEGIGLAPVTADVITAMVTGESMSPLFEKVLAEADPNRFTAGDTEPQR